MYNQNESNHSQFNHLCLLKDDIIFYKQNEKIIYCPIFELFGKRFYKWLFIPSTKLESLIDQLRLKWEMIHSFLEIILLKLKEIFMNIISSKLKIYSKREGLTPKCNTKISKNLSLEDDYIKSKINLDEISIFDSLSRKLISFNDFSDECIKLFFSDKKKYNFKEYFDFIYKVTKLNSTFFNKRNKVILYLSILYYCLDMFRYECKLIFDMSLFSKLVIYSKCSEKKIISVSKKISAMEENYSCETETYFKYIEI